MSSSPESRVIVSKRPYTTYSGSLSENHHKYLAGFKLWAASVNYNDEQKAAEFCSLLTGEAASKIHTLDPSVRQDWGALQEEFLNYAQSPSRKVIWSTELFRLRLEPGKSVDKYIETATDLGEKLGLSDADVAMHLTTNLTGEYYKLILPLGLTRLDDIIAKIRLLDRGGVASKENADFHTVTKGLTDAQKSLSLSMQKQIQDIKTSMEKISREMTSQ